MNNEQLVYAPPYTMPADEYKSASSGSLKLKGVASSSKISKQKKKRPKTTDNAPPHVNAGSLELIQSVKDGGPHEDLSKGEDTEDVASGKAVNHGGGQEATSLPGSGKTEAEVRHEERRRKRVCDAPH